LNVLRFWSKRRLFKITLMDPDNKTLILQSAREVFKKYGFRKTTLEDIASATGRGKSSLYYYFRNKEDIFEGVLEMEVGRLKTEFLAAVGSMSSARAKLRIYIIRRMELFRQLISFYPSFRNEFTEYYGYIEKIRAKYDKEEVEIISGILRDGIREKEFVIPDVELTAQVIIKAMKGFEFPWALQQEQAGMEHDIDSMLQVLFYGLVKRKK
jgi:AcrR family transcriptional regulator